MLKNIDICKLSDLSSKPIRKDEEFNNKIAQESLVEK